MDVDICIGDIIVWQGWVSAYLCEKCEGRLPSPLMPGAEISCGGQVQQRHEEEGVEEGRSEADQGEKATGRHHRHRRRGGRGRGSGCRRLWRLVGCRG